MLHVASAAFYTAVQQRLDATPVVFVEGLLGPRPDQIPAPSRSPGTAAVDDRFAFARLAAALGLRAQTEALVLGPHWRQVDMTLAEYLRRAPPGSAGAGGTGLRELEQELAFQAFWQRRLDPSLGLEASHELVRAGSGRKRFADFVLESAAGAAAGSELAPERRAMLLAAVAALAGSREGGPPRVALCWGLAHMESLRCAFEQQGYRLARTVWQTAFAWRSGARTGLEVDEPPAQEVDQAGRALPDGP